MAKTPKYPNPAFFRAKNNMDWKAQGENLKEFLTRNDVFPDHILEGNLSAGSEFPDEKVVWFSDADIFEKTRVRRRRKSRQKNAEPIKSFVDIRPGDYVVHETHGIGRFMEIRQLEVEGIKRDYLMIGYAGKDVLYVPVDQMDNVQKYIGGDGVTVRVNKLSGSEWKKAKQNARAAIERMDRCRFTPSANTSVVMMIL